MEMHDIIKRVELANITQLSKIIGIPKQTVYSIKKRKICSKENFAKLVDFYTEFEKVKRA